MSESTVKILVPQGQLGGGVREDEVRYGIEHGAQAIACDGGSVDSGAAYLALGIAKNVRDSVKRDLSIMMKAGSEAGIPVIVGTAGQAGGDMNVDGVKEIALEIASELGINPRIAILYSEQSPDLIKAKNASGRIRPLSPSGPLTDADVEACDHIVAALGAEPYIEALRQGADVIIGGRTTDTAVISCFPLMKGAHAGASWHAAKVAECGAQCAVERTGSGVLVTIDASGFEIETLNTVNHCTPETVSAHMLYENSDPFRLIEPGGVLDVTNSVYTQVRERAVRVEGSVWETQPYTLKLEGAGRGRFQTIMIVGIEDPEVLGRIQEWHDNLLAALNERVQKVMGLTPGAFHISLRLYGWNAVSGRIRPADTAAPLEVGVVFVATADTQKLASQIAKCCNPYFFHYPINMNAELPSFAFPFGPADIDRGPIYEFKLNHVVEIDDPLELVRTDWVRANEMEVA